MSNHKNLAFFNKEGDSLNFDYNIYTERFEGDIMFDENSSDTYKTYGIYTMERIPAFEFEKGESLTLDKFQLFNEWGFHFYGGPTESHPVLQVEPANNDPRFYSKWIYGIDFDSKFPIGTLLTFTKPFTEFTDPKRTYAVVGTKMNAVMLVTDVDNMSFEMDYFETYSLDSSYSTTTDEVTTYKIFVKAVNAVGVYNYIDSQLRNNLSKWNEQNFYDRIYDKRKLNLVNTEKNDGVVTVKDSELIDAVCFEYFISTIAKGKDLVIEYVSRGDLPKIYDGPITITSTGNIQLNTILPDIFKPGLEFKIVGSYLNNINLSVADITPWTNLYKPKSFNIGDQVFYDNRIYECVKAYTHDFSNPSLTDVNPLSRDYWVPSSSAKLNQTTNAESLAKAQIYLTSDTLSFAQGYTQSSVTTFGMAVDRFAGDLKSLNVDLYVKNGVLRADLMYPTKYAEINFYAGNDNTQLGTTTQTNERLIEVRERLKTEYNYNFSQNFQYNIVFTDIDYYGIKLTINKQVYQEEGAIIFTGPLIDIERSIDRTLRKWLNRHYIALNLLGINAELYYIGSQGSPFFNSIILKTQYPNVPIRIDKIEVGSTADFHIEHTKIVFNGTQSIGATVNISINGTDYEQETIFNGLGGQNPDVPATLEAWVQQHGEYLQDVGLYSTNINNILKFDIKRTDPDFVITAKNGKLLLPGQTEVQLTDKTKGSVGAIITSNSILLPNEDEPNLKSVGFATGMALSVNNTVHPYMNVEYNALYVDKKRINLSYEGPFWGLTDSLCETSPYVTVAFNSGFGATGCPPPDIIGIGSPFEIDAFTYSSFTKYLYYTKYDKNGFLLSDVPGSSNMVDLKYIQISDSVFILADNLIVMDAVDFNYVTYVPLTGNSNSIKLEYNEYNNYLYCLSQNRIWVVDPVINIVMYSIALTKNASDFAINPNNGDVYVTFTNSPTIDVYDWNGTLQTSIATPSTSDTLTGKIVYNSFADDMFVTTDGDYVIRINSDRTIETSYSISGLQTSTILYEPVNESVYVWSSTNLWRITDGVATSVPSVSTTAFKTAIFNNLSGEVNISDNDGFRSLSLETDELSLNEPIGDYGYITLNQFDGNVYMSSQNSKNIQVINSGNGWVIHSESVMDHCTKIIYNQARKSVWTIQPTTRSVIEVFPNISTDVKIERIDAIGIEDKKFGTLADDYVKKTNLWVKTREYLRKPRENYEGEPQVQYYWEWFDDQTPEFFIYDTTGDQLAYTGSFSYTGPKPLGDVPLNKKPNNDPKKADLPEFQQTVFDRVFHTLDYIDSTTETDSEPEAIQTFLGFKSEDEGPKKSIVQLYKKEPISFNITSTGTNETVVTYTTKNDGNGRNIGEIRINDSSTVIFSERGLKRGQILTTELTDITNREKQYNSYNNGSVFKIRDVYRKLIVVDFIKSSDFMDFDSTIKTDWPSKGKTTYLRAGFRVLDREIGRFRTMAQTEIEDMRFKINLNNIGKNINPADVYIFKDYDIKEGGVDWKFLNTKRKEMLMNKNLIYTYVGAYKSIINAINFFGYNDLQLNEYYRNINPKSKEFLKLFKVEIPDIFDNSVQGWTSNDFLDNSMPNENFEETNLFNLTYDITDKEGENLLTYTVEEVTLKLQGLKFWLSKNIIPLTHKIQDITGKSYFKGNIGITHTQHDVKTLVIRENATPISFRLTEAYLLPVNSGSTVYNCVLDFYSIIPGIGAKKPKDDDGNDLIKPYNGFELQLPDYYTVKIRTWKTYKEWAPFTTYAKGDRVFYYDKIYESVADLNKLNNPRKYEDVDNWSELETYVLTNLVKYKRRTYTFTGLGTLSGNNPYLNNGDNADWLDVTSWIEIDLEPVQTLHEFRMITGTMSNPLTPYNFTVDSNIDPYITIEVSTENGYGGLYTDKKNYEIRGIKDLTQKLVPIERIGPFQPIEFLT